MQNENEIKLPLSEEEAPSKVEMSAEEYNRGMREVYLGNSAVLPDGRSVKEVRANIQRLEKEQDEARAQVGKKAEPETMGTVIVNTTSTGVVTADLVIVETEAPLVIDPPEEIGDEEALNDKTNLPEHSAILNDSNPSDED